MPPVWTLTTENKVAVAVAVTQCEWTFSWSCHCRHTQCKHHHPVLWYPLFLLSLQLFPLSLPSWMSIEPIRELYTRDENYCIFATKNLKLTVHVRWQENCKILQLKIIYAHNSCNNGHGVQLMMFNWDHVKISLAFVFIVAFVTRDFYRKEKIAKTYTDL